eukprot:sb/3467884/
MDSEDGDSDKENRDPALMEPLITPPSGSLKRKHKRRKHRASPSPGLVANVEHHCSLTENSFVFAKFVDIWEPGRVIQMTSPFNIVCFRFLKDDIGSASQTKICSFLKYGSKVDFDLLESDTTYRKGIISAVAEFANIHRPDLLRMSDRDTMLLDWARFGFIGCKLLKSPKYSKSGRVLFPDSPHVLSELVENSAVEEENRPTTSSRSSIPSPLVRSEGGTPKRRKISCRTEDSGYCSSPAITQSEVGCFVMGKLRGYGWWPGRKHYTLSDYRARERPPAL